MITYKDLALASFDNDTLTSERDLEACLPIFDTTLEHVNRIAEQRALRAILILQRGEGERIKEQALSGTFSIEELSVEEQHLFVYYVAIWMDGLLTGLRAGKREWVENA